MDKRGRQLQKRSLTGPLRQAVALLAAYAFLFHALLPLIHQPPRSDPGAGLPAWVMAGLCRGAPVPAAPNAATSDPADGAEATASAGDRGPVEPLPPGTPSPDKPVCPICLAMQIAGTFLLPMVQAVPARQQPVIVFVGFVETDPLLVASHRGIPQARGPPAAV